MNSRRHGSRIDYTGPSIASLVLLLSISLLAAGCIPRTAALLNRAGLEQYRHERYEEAYNSFSEAIALSPDWPQAYVNRATAAEKLARIKDADADLTRAIELDAGYTEAYLLRGDLSFARRRYEHARADWSAALALAPGNAAIYQKRGGALAQLGRTDEAVADFDRAVALSPNDPEPLICRGRFYFETGRFDRAVADFTSAARLAPDTFQPYLYRGLVYEYGLLATKEALADYSRAVKNAPGDPYVLNYRANLLRKLGRSADALADFSAICRMGYPFGCWQYDWLIDETR